MRYYKIVTPNMTWDATGDPNALNVEFDIPVSLYHNPGASGAFARIWGIPLSLLLQANQFNNQQIQVYGGMQTGLPLANPNQAGLLVQGTILPCLGNWVNTDMTLDFYIPFGGGESNPAKPANIIHNWQQGQPLSNAVQNALQTAFPAMTAKINISPNLKLNYTDTGPYQTLGQYATYLFQISKSIMNSASYLGVGVSVQGNTINVSDGTQQSPGGTINFQDLVGQPIWTRPTAIQFKTVMRGDLNIGQTVTLPQSLATLTYEGDKSGVGAANNLIQGDFLIQQMRHTGNFRQPDWTSWVTTIDAVMPPTGGGVGHA